MREKERERGREGRKRGWGADEKGLFERSERETVNGAFDARKVPSSQSTVQERKKQETRNRHRHSSTHRKAKTCSV